MTFPTLTTPTTLTSLASGSSPYTVNLPSVAAGDLLLIILATDGNATVAGNLTTFATGTLWSNSTASTLRISVYYRICDGSEASTVTYTQSAGEDFVCRVLKYAAGSWHGTTPPQAATPAGGTSTSPNPPALTPSWGAEDTQWIAVAFPNSTQNSAPAGYPSNCPDNQLGARSRGATGQATLYLATANVNTATFDPDAFSATVSGSVDWQAGTIAVRGPGGASMRVEVSWAELEVPGAAASGGAKPWHYYQQLRRAA